MAGHSCNAASESNTCLCRNLCHFSKESPAIGTFGWIAISIASGDLRLKVWFPGMPLTNPLNLDTFAIVYTSENVSSMKNPITSK